MIFLPYKRSVEDSDRHWIVFGARTPLGKAFCDLVVQRGGSVTRITRSGADQISMTGSDLPAAWLQVDITDPQNRQTLISRFADFPHVGLFFGHGHYPQAGYDASRVAYNYSVNADGPIRLVRSWIRHIEDRQALRENANDPQSRDPAETLSIIAVGSAAAHHLFPKQPAYALSKAYLEVGMARLGSTNGLPVQVTTAVPGFLRSETHDQSVVPSTRSALGRMLPEEKPEQVARLALFWVERRQKGGATHFLWKLVISALKVVSLITPLNTAIDQVDENLQPDPADQRS